MKLVPKYSTIFALPGITIVHAIKDVIITMVALVDIKFINDIIVAGIQLSGLDLPKHISVDLCQPTWHTSHLEGLVP